MFKNRTPFFILGLALLAIQFLLFTPACTNDELPAPTVSAVCDTLMPTYDATVKAIIDESCAYSGCHSSGGGVGPGNYSNYAGILSILENDRFRERVFNTSPDNFAFMPPKPSTYPALVQKDSLTSEELQILECWLNQGFPEN